MMRFLVANFPIVVSMLLPTGSPDDIRKLLESDPDYFNNLTYDQCVESMTNVLLVSSKLYPYGEPIQGAEDDKSKYSKITGLHTLQWGPGVAARQTKAFNDMVDLVRHHTAEGNDQASKVSVLLIRTNRSLARALIYRFQKP